MAKQLRNAIAKMETKAEKQDAVTYTSTPEPKVCYCLEKQLQEGDCCDQSARTQVPKNIFSPSLTLDDVDEEEVARQLTLIEYEVNHKPFT